MNCQLWTIENDIRAREGAGDFGERFIDLGSTPPVDPTWWTKKVTRLTEQTETTGARGSARRG